MCGSFLLIVMRLSKCEMCLYAVCVSCVCVYNVHVHVSVYTCEMSQDNQWFRGILHITHFTWYTRTCDCSHGICHSWNNGTFHEQIFTSIIPGERERVRDAEECLKSGIRIQAL